MLEFHSHYSGSSGNLYTVTDSDRQGDYSLAIECGVSFRDIQAALWASSLRMSALDGVLVSHAHGDHARAAKDMMIKGGVNCYASADTWRSLSIDSHHAYTVAAMDEINICGRWVVKPFDLKHDYDGTLGFLIQGVSGDKVVYISDTCYSPYRFDNVKIIAIECNHSEELIRANADAGAISKERFDRTYGSHMSLERLLAFLAACDLSRVREIHLLHLSDENSDEAAFKAAVQAATGIPCLVAPKRLQHPSAFASPSASYPKAASNSAARQAPGVILPPGAEDY